MKNIERERLYAQEQVALNGAITAIHNRVIDMDETISALEQQLQALQAENERLRGLVEAVIIEPDGVSLSRITTESGDTMAWSQARHKAISGKEEG